MELIKVEREVPKETKELVDPIVGLVKHFKNGGSVEDAAAFLPAMLKAIEGIEKVPAELKAEAKKSALYMVDEVWGIFE